MAYDWERRLDQRCSSIDQKLDELKGLLRAFAATRRITSAPAQGMGQIQPCEQVEDRTLYVKIHLEEFLISWEILDQVFSSFGNLEIIEVFDDEAQFHSRIRFQNPDSALKAFDSLNTRCIYDDCCRLELFLGSQSNDISSDMPCDVETQSPIEDARQVEEFKEPYSSRELCEMESKDSSSKTKKLDSDLVTNQSMGESFQEMGDIDGQLSPSSKQLMVASESINDSSEVISDSFESVIPSITFEGSMEFGLADLKLKSVEYEETSKNAIAHKVFAQMSRHGVFSMGTSVINHDVKSIVVIEANDRHRLWDGDLTFDPGIVGMNQKILKQEISGKDFSESRCVRSREMHVF